MAGIYGNTAEEAVYPAYLADASGQILDTSKFNYWLTFEPGKLPPVKAFWSVTMYDGKTLPQLMKNADGGITLYLQRKSPGTDLESNWLPAPEGRWES